DMIGDPGGHQDQYAVAIGGLNRIEFSAKRVSVKRLAVSRERLRAFKDTICLFFLGLERFSGDILAEQKARHKENHEQLVRTLELVDLTESVLVSNEDFSAFGTLLDEAWALKKSFATGISNKFVDDVYKEARSAGAWGGKLLGAGSAGFMMLSAPPELHAQIEKRLPKLLKVPFAFEESGSVLLSNGIDND
ncbi:MAG: kinase, partial [Lentisphaerae bacterium]|nr:kinase [Lentisphaerota bacterium]